MKKGSVKKNLLILILPLLALVVIVIMMINFTNTKKIMTDFTYQELEEESKYHTKVIASWKNGMVSVLNTVQHALETIDFDSSAEELEYLTEVTEYMIESIPFGMYEGGADGTYLDGSGWVPDADYIIAERDWYKDGLNNDSFEFGNPYLDANTGSFVVSASACLKRNDKTPMVAAVDIPLDDMAKMVSEIQVMKSESGFAFLVDSSSDTILAHRDSQWNAYVISKQDSNSIFANVAGYMDIDTFHIYEMEQSGKKFFVAMEPVEGTKWLLVSCVAQSEVFEKLNQMLVLYIIIALVAIIISAIVIGRVIHVTVLPITGLTESISRISDGDFKVQIEPKGNDEITVMSSAMKKYVSEMGNVIANIRDISDKLEENATSGKSSSATLKENAHTQAQAMSDMQSAIEQLAYAVNEIAENATSLAQTVETANTQGNQANNHMQKTVEMADKGYQDMQKVHSGMENVVGSMKELEVVVDSVGQSTEEINNIIQLIGSIASQTNLLSLNASIEAARAGEVGRGFAVVADEIGKLADESARAVQQIEEIIHKITSQVSDMVGKTNVSVGTIEDNSVVVNEACASFKEIFDDIITTSHMIEAVLKEIQVVNDVAGNMAAISQQQSASTEEISATIDNMTQTAKDVAAESEYVESSSEVLHDSAKALSEYMFRFKI